MNYKLAKKLKDAGFPQNRYRDGALVYVEGKEDWKFPMRMFTPSYRGFQMIDFERGLIVIPTLSELIDTCGGYICLIKEAGYWMAYYSDKPFQSVNNTTSIDLFMEDAGEGNTPQEAVANLWLELKENK